MKNRNSYFGLGLIGLLLTIAFHIFVTYNPMRSAMLNNIVWVFYIVFAGFLFMGITGAQRKPWRKRKEGF